MSRLNQLPPRCPIPKKLSLNPVADTFYSASSPTESYISQCNSLTQESTLEDTLEDQPAWLDELLGDKTDEKLNVTVGGGGGGRGPLRRSVSDSFVVLGDMSENFSAFNQSEDEESLTSETCGELESACVYGPNSPRAKNNASFSNNPIASAFSDYGSQNSDDTLKGINSSPVAENVDIPNAKRNPGQRSRVRKLQYIAELERKVVMLQALEADLSVQLASLIQANTADYLENMRLKQKLAMLTQRKIIQEGKCELMKKEIQRLRSKLTNSSSNASPRSPSSNLDWNLLDVTKFNLN